MRIKVTLEKKDLKKKGKIPINYNSFLTEFLYNTMSVVDEKLKEKMHDNGYDEKKRKLFTFSKIFGETHQKDKEEFLSIGKRDIDIYFSFLLDEEGIKFSEGINQRIKQKDEFYLGNNQAKTYFRIISSKMFDQTNIKLYNPPFSGTETINYFALTGLTIQDDEINKNPFSHEFADKIKTNLFSKFKTYCEIREYISNISKNDIKITITGISRKHKNDEKENGDKKISSKKVIVKQQDENFATRQRWYCYLTIVAPAEIQRVAYYSGLGHSNGMGLGFLIVDKKNEYLQSIRKI